MTASDQQGCYFNKHTLQQKLLETSIDGYTSREINGFYKIRIARDQERLLGTSIDC